MMKSMMMLFCLLVSGSARAGHFVYTPDINFTKPPEDLTTKQLGRIASYKVNPISLNAKTEAEAGNEVAMQIGTQTKEIAKAIVCYPGRNGTERCRKESVRAGIVAGGTVAKISGSERSELCRLNDESVNKKLPKCGVNLSWDKSGRRYDNGGIANQDYVKLEPTRKVYVRAGRIAQ